MRTLSFWTKLFAPLGKVMTLWCKHQNLARDTVRFFSSTGPLEWDATAAGQGWSPGELVVLDALGMEEAAARAAVAPVADGAAASPTTPRAATAALSVTVLCDGAEPVEFKMKATTALEKMMVAWRKQCQLPADTAVDFHDGDTVLSAKDTPRSRGWLQRSEVIVKASTEALKAPKVPAPEAAAPKVPAAVAPAATAPEGEPLPKISLQVVATDQDGSHTVTFKLRPDSPLEKMMNAWCKNMQVEPSAAVFEYRGQLLRPSDTLQSLGADDKEPVITARPSQVATATPAAPAAPAAAAEAAAPAAAAPASNDEVILVHIISIGEDGRNVLDFKMKPKAPFKTALEAWCDHHGIPQDQVLFEFQGAPLLPSKSPAECGWQSAFGTLEIEARPVGGEEEDISAKSGEGEKIDVHVLALTDTGQTATCNFKMKVTSSFEKMMNAWCQFQGVPESMADFEFNGRTLSPKDTPASCSFSAKDGVMRITAKPKEEAAATSASAEVSQHASPPMDENRRPETVQEQKSTQQSEVDEKVSIQVVAHADGGDNVTDFKMKSSSSFDKMMKAWCKCNGIPESEAVFEYNGRELLPEDTPASCSWSSRDGVMRITAKPKDETAATSASPSAKESQDAANADAKDEPVQVQVAAAGANGEQVTNFKLKMTTNFGKLMNRWCSYNGVPQASACFQFQEKEISETDTLLSIGAQGPTVSIRVVPRNAQAAHAATNKRNLKRKSQTSDGTAPAAKRAANAYQLFTKERRQSLATEQPDLKFGEVTKILSAEWKALNEDERRPYQEMAQKAKENAQATQVDASVDGSGAASAADGADNKPVDKKVEVNILAEGADGTSEMKVTVRTSMALKRLMQAWCDHHELPLEEADFLLGTRVLRYEDTLDSLGCSDNVEVKAVPKGDTPADASASAGAAHSVAVDTTPKAVPKAVAKPLRSARGRGVHGAKRGKRKSRGGDKSSEDSLELPEEATTVSAASSAPAASSPPARRSKRLQESGQVIPNATLVHHLPTPRKEKGVPGGEVSKRMSFREYLQFDREQEKMRSQERLARQKRKFVNGDSSDEELHMALALSLSESQDAQKEDSVDSQRPQDREPREPAEEISPAAA